jgi:hypothetical protein
MDQNNLVQKQVWAGIVVRFSSIWKLWKGHSARPTARKETPPPTLLIFSSRDGGAGFSLREIGNFALTRIWFRTFAIP